VWSKKNFIYFVQSLLERKVDAGGRDDVGASVADVIGGNESGPLRSDRRSTSSHRQLSERALVSRQVTAPTSTSVALDGVEGPGLVEESLSADSDLAGLARFGRSAANEPVSGRETGHVAVDVVARLHGDLGGDQDTGVEGHVPGLHRPVVARISRILENGLDDIEDCGLGIDQGHPIVVLQASEDIKHFRVAGRIRGNSEVSEETIEGDVLGRVERGIGEPAVVAFQILGISDLLGGFSPVLGDHFVDIIGAGVDQLGNAVRSGHIGESILFVHVRSTLNSMDAFEGQSAHGSRAEIVQAQN